MPRPLPDGYAEATRAAYDEERRDHGVGWGYCFCGCGQPTRVAASSHVKAGILKGLPLRFVGSHNRTSDYHYGRSALYAVEDRGYETPCWIWQRAMTKPGYGKYKNRWAHRWMYEEHIGPIPEGDQLHHLCAVKACVRPDHLRPMPTRDHVRLGERVILNEASVRALKRDVTLLCECYGIARSTLQEIVRGRQWSDVPWP